MIILDTNVVSEFMTSPPDGSVLNWLNTQETTSLYLSTITITIAEIGFGLATRNVKDFEECRIVLVNPFRE